MNTQLLIALLVTTPSEWQLMCALQDFDSCQDDFTLKPPDGVLHRNSFSWLGFVQYKHGLLHHSLAPRVVLVQKQFAVGTAKELLQIPNKYKLGNIIFGEYEREEADCGKTQSQLRKGERCPHSYLETPLLTIIPHPEYTRYSLALASRFGVQNSLALVKLLRPMKSRYMTPICLPSLAERSKKKKKLEVYLIDYLSNVPFDFSYERMGKKTLQLYPDGICRVHNYNVYTLGVSNLLCSSGCGVRVGAPIIIQGAEGAFELIGVAVGGGVCRKKSMRNRFIQNPPVYIDVYPYSSWIINVITANELPLAYPQNYRPADQRGSSMATYSEYLRTPERKKNIYEGWRGRTYMVGNFCRRSLKRQKRAKAAFFYYETFQVTSGELPTTLTFRMKISSGIDCTIICARLKLPNRYTKPRITGIGGFNITVEFKTNKFPYNFDYTLGLTGKNSTERKINKWMDYIRDKI